MPRRQRDRHLSVRSPIELGRTTGTWPAPAATAPVLGVEQAGRGEPIEVEGGQLAADPERCGRIIAADRLAERRIAEVGRLRGIWTG